MKDHDFEERMQFNEGVISTCVLDRIIKDIASAESYRRATKTEDRSGTDWWILRRHGLPPLSVDLKNRGYCPIERFARDDVCIETTSVYVGPRNGKWQDQYRRKPGWTIDETKRSDYILYTWPSEGDARRYWLVPFPFLCTVAQRYWRQWAGSLGEIPTGNKGYLTLNVFPLRRTVTECLRPLFANQAVVSALANQDWAKNVAKVQQLLWPDIHEFGNSQ